MGVGRTKIAGHSLRTRLSLAVPGVVTQRGTISIRKRTVTVCRSRVEVDRARSLNLRCKLNAIARERLERHRLKVSLTTRFTPADGLTESSTRSLTVPRD
jgi:hypothetical protein